MKLDTDLSLAAILLALSGLASLLMIREAPIVAAVLALAAAALAWRVARRKDPPRGMRLAGWAILVVAVGWTALQAVLWWA